MQISRLFGIVYLLLERKKVTAKELSERFEVSIRTIYRDLDNLSAAGIPIYTINGRNGGISLLDNFIINKSLLSESEQNEILIGLQSLTAVNYPNIDNALSKMKALFNKTDYSWIEVDFSRWGSDNKEKEKFNLLKTSIIEKQIITFHYFNSYGNNSIRQVEPVKLIYKDKCWYLQGFCLSKKDYRIFKISRIKQLEITEQCFSRIHKQEQFIESDIQNYNPIIDLELFFSSHVAYRLYDVFDENAILKNTNGTFKVTISLPEDEWLYGFIMSFGDDVEIIKPKYIRDRISERLEKALKKYKKYKKT